jgi:predicted kinase
MTEEQEQQLKYLLDKVLEIDDTIAAFMHDVSIDVERILARLNELEIDVSDARRDIMQLEKNK